MSKKELNKTQLAGLVLVGLSLITYFGGGIFASSWLASVEASGVHIYVVDAETGQHIPKDLVTVDLTGFSYFGADYPLSVTLRASRTTPTFWSFSSSLCTLYYVRVSATGYVTQTGSVSMPVNFIAEYTYKLSPEPEPGEPEPEPLPPEEPEPVELKAEVYVNDALVEAGGTVQVTTLSLAFRVVVTEGGFQQIWGFVDEDRLVFEVSDNLTEATASYTLPGDGTYDVNIRVLDVGGEERPLASFSAIRGSAAAESNPVEDAVEEALTQGSTMLSMALGLLGAGLFTLGSAREEDGKR